MERLLKSVGRLPAAFGKGLDHVAKLPLIGLPVKLFSSVWFGIALLVLIGSYIAFGSGLPELRAKMEMTDLQFFDAWPMRVLLACLALDLTIVTLRRIPLTLFKLGVWTVHVGILTLIGGCVYYFALKEEGAVRLFLNRPAEYSYDVTERALFAFPEKPDGSYDWDNPTITKLPTLPIFYEHGATFGKPLDIALTSAIPGSDAQIRIKGYYPAAIMKLLDYRPGSATERGVGPALTIVLKSSKDNMGEGWLLAKSPSGRVIDGNLPCGIEYLYHPTPERIRELQASFDGDTGITVRIPKLNIEKTYVVEQDKPIVVEGSPYTLTPVSKNEMPMLSPGYERASSTALSLKVARKDPDKIFEYTRMSLFRYPELSPDFITEDGKPKRVQAGVDPDIQIIFHDATVLQTWIVEGDDGKLTLIMRTPEGKSTTQPLTDKAVLLPVKESPGLELSVNKRTANAVAITEPEIIPPEQRPRAQAVGEIIHYSMLDMEVSKGAWTASHIYVPFFAFAQAGDRPALDTPAFVEIPAADGKPAKKVAFMLSTARRELPSRLTLTKFEPIKFKGATKAYSDYRSTIAATDRKTSETHTLVAHLNNPATDQGIYYFQAAWDGDDNAPDAKRFSVIGVANRPGMPAMIMGAILIAVGIGYSFYLKPYLLNKKKESLAAWAKINAQK